MTYFGAIRNKKFKIIKKQVTLREIQGLRFERWFRKKRSGHPGYLSPGRNYFPHNRMGCIKIFILIQPGTNGELVRI